MAQGIVRARMATLVPLLWGPERMEWDKSYAAIEDVVPQYAGTAEGEVAALGRRSIQCILWPPGTFACSS